MTDTTVKKEPVFTKAQLLASKKYEADRDIISVVLEDGFYTEKQIVKAIELFKKGKVN